MSYDSSSEIEENGLSFQANTDKDTSLIRDKVGLQVGQRERLLYIS